MLSIICSPNTWLSLFISPPLPSFSLLSPERSVSLLLLNSMRLYWHRKQTSLSFSDWLCSTGASALPGALSLSYRYSTWVQQPSKHTQQGSHSQLDGHHSQHQPVSSICDNCNRAVHHNEVVQTVEWFSKLQLLGRFSRKLLWTEMLIGTMLMVAVMVTQLQIGSLMSVCSHLLCRCKEAVSGSWVLNLHHVIVIVVHGVEVNLPDIQVHLEKNFSFFFMNLFWI